MSPLWPLVRRSLAARPLRAGLTVLAVALGVAAVLALLLTVDSLDNEAAAAQQASAGSSGLDVRVDSGAGLTAAQIRTIAALPGVRLAAPLHEKRVVAVARGAGSSGVSVTLVGVRAGDAGLRPVEVVAGRLPSGGSLAEVAIDQGLASAISRDSAHPLRIGDRLQLFTSTGPDQFRIVGLTAGTSGGPAFTRSAVFVDDAAATGTFRLGLRVPLVALELAPGTSAATVAAEVHSGLGSGVATVDPRAAAAEPLADLRPLLALVTFVTLVLGAVVTANSAALAVTERRREIGLLRAAGASTGHVFRLFAAETLAVALFGTPLGVAGGLGLAVLLGHVFTPAGLPVPALTLSPIEVAGAVGLGFVAALIGGLVPAAAACRLSILVALRPRPVSQGTSPRGRTIVVAAAGVLAAAALGCFLEGGSLLMPGVACFLAATACAMPALAPPLAAGLARAAAPFAPASLAASRNLSRHRTRTVLTAAGVAVTVAVAVAVSALSAGALAASDAWVNGLLPGDTLLTSSVTQRDAVAAAVAGETGTGVTELRILSEPVGGLVVGITATDPARFAFGAPLSRELGERPAVLVPAALAAATGWSPGAQLEATGIHGTVRLTVAGIVAHGFPAGDGSETLIMDTTEARAVFGTPASGFDDLVLAHATPAAPAVAVRYGLEAVPVGTVAAAARDAVSHTIGLVAALAVLTVVIAVIAIINTLVVNVREGTREIALLRAVGLGTRHALRLVLGEAALVAAGAAGTGAAAGCLLALPLLRAAAAPGFAPSFSFPLLTGVVLAAGVILSGLAATFGPARRAVSTSVLTALRQE